MRQRRKRSAAITLVLAGTLSGCSESVPQQDVYRSLADCQSDWREPGQCQPVRDNEYPDSYYYGPVHCDGDATPKPSRSAMTAVARGGFGCLARYHSTGS